MVKVTLFGGVGEVGGNQFVVEAGKTRVLLDFGTRMGYEGQYFGDLLDARGMTAVKDRLVIGALPNIPGIYAESQFRPVGIDAVEAKGRLIDGSHPYFQHEVISYEQYKAKEKRPFVDGLLVSHAHIDHVGAVGYLHHDIPLYCTATTETIIRAIDEIAGAKFKTEAIDTSERSLAICGPRTDHPGMPEHKNVPVSRTVKAMGDWETAKLGDMKITLIEVDHSIPGAASYLIEAGGKKVLYTGDIRFHGTKPMTIDEYAEKVGKGIDLMMCEGTRVDTDHRLTEADVGAKIGAKMKSTKGVLFIDFGWKDTTRYETVRDAAKKAGRTLVINTKIAFLLHKLGQFPKKTDNVKVFLKRNGSGLYSPRDYMKSKLSAGIPGDAEMSTAFYDEGVVADDIRNAPGKYVMMLSYYDLNQLFDLAEGGKIPGSFFVKASCEPFSDEMEMDEERYIAWLDRFGIVYDTGRTPVPDGCTNKDCEKLRARMDRSHVSGHASGPELKELIAKVAPRTLIPIHSPNPGAFPEIIRAIEKDGGPKVNLILPEYGRTYEA
jgi:ribonuclease J